MILFQNGIGQIAQAQFKRHFYLDTVQFFALIAIGEWWIAVRWFRFGLCILGLFRLWHFFVQRLQVIVAAVAAREKCFGLGEFLEEKKSRQASLENWQSTYSISYIVNWSSFAIHSIVFMCKTGTPSGCRTRAENFSRPLQYRANWLNRGIMLRHTMGKKSTPTDFLSVFLAIRRFACEFTSRVRICMFIFMNIMEAQRFDCRLRASRARWMQQSPNKKSIDHLNERMNSELDKVTSQLTWPFSSCFCYQIFKRYLCISRMILIVEIMILNLLEIFQRLPMIEKKHILIYPLTPCIFPTEPISLASAKFHSDSMNSEWIFA